VLTIIELHVLHALDKRKNSERENNEIVTVWIIKLFLISISRNST
jgi:hypothetical protein